MPATTLQALSTASAAGESGKSHLGQSGKGNAFRDASRFIKKWGLRWNIPYSYFHFTKDIVVPYLSPRAIVGHLLGKCPQLLFGGVKCPREAQKNLASFWEGYRAMHANHQVFETHSDYLTNVIPMLWHGDEGRGVRKGNTAVCSLESPLGLDTFTTACYNECDCCIDAGQDPAPLWQRQNINLKYHSFLTRFVMFVLPKKHYKGNDLLMQLASIIARELRSLYFEGIEIQGKLWHICCIGLKGDMQWFLKLAELDRSFTRLSTRSDQPCCHECLAGSANVPFEDTSRCPAWAATTYTQRPWRQPPSSNILLIPFDQAAPERMLRRDIFHNTKVGTFQDFIGGAILLVAELGYFRDASQSNSRQMVLQRMHGHFQLFCSAAGKSPSLMSFSKIFLNVPSRKHYGWAKCKGSDAMILMQWIIIMTGSCLNTLISEEHRSTILALRSGAEAGHAWVSKMYKHGLWWRRDCAESITKLGRLFVRRYSYLAWVCLNKWKFPAFAMKPKLHMICHELVDVERMVANNEERILSCLAFNCETNEDLIGRMSRLSRRCHQTRVSERVLELYLTKAHALFKRYVKDPLPGQAKPNKKRRLDG